MAYVELKSQQFSTRHQCRLIRARSLVSHLPILVLWNNSVANGQEGKELPDDLLLPIINLWLTRRRWFERISITFKDFLEFLKCFPASFSIFAFPLGVVNLLRESSSSYTTTSELHLVTRQCTSFVTKDVFNLPEFLNKRRCTANGRSVRLCVVHIEIRVD